jgi:hypothetical protein
MGEQRPSGPRLLLMPQPERSASLSVFCPAAYLVALERRSLGRTHTATGAPLVPERHRHRGGRLSHRPGRAPVGSIKRDDPDAGTATAMA